MNRKYLVLILATTLCLALALSAAESKSVAPPAGNAAAETATGLLVAKGDDWVSIRPGTNAPGVRYETADKEIASMIAGLVVPSEVKLAWKPMGEKKILIRIEASAALATAGTVEGTVSAKGLMMARLPWIEVTSACGVKEQFFASSIMSNDTAVLAPLKLGDNVRLHWIYRERKRVKTIEKLAQ